MPNLEDLNINNGNLDMESIMSKVQERIQEKVGAPPVHQQERVQEKIEAPPVSQPAHTPQTNGGQKTSTAPSATVHEIDPQTVLQDIDLDAVE